MAAARVYTDEDVHAAVALGLRRRGFDVLTTLEAGRSGTSDESQLDFAASAGRVLLTFNRGDFARLHAERASAANARWTVRKPIEIRVAGGGEPSFDRLSNEFRQRWSIQREGWASARITVKSRLALDVEQWELVR